MLELTQVDTRRANTLIGAGAGRNLEGTQNVALGYFALITGKGITLYL